MRRGRPSLLGTMARTAVIAGTATKVSGAVAHKQAEQQTMAQQAAEFRAAAAAAPATAPAPTAPAPEPAGVPAGVDRIAQLKDLAELKAAGVLTEAEFAAEKARILAS